jgi:hypothetical protein
MISLIDPAVARKHLELAEKHIAEGQLRVAAQLELVARLQRHGHETQEAKTLLHLLEQILALEVRTRDRLAGEGTEGM